MRHPGESQAQASAAAAAAHAAAGGGRSLRRRGPALPHHRHHHYHRWVTVADWDRWIERWTWGPSHSVCGAYRVLSLFISLDAPNAPHALYTLYVHAGVGPRPRSGPQEGEGTAPAMGPMGAGGRRRARKKSGRSVRSRFSCRARSRHHRQRRWRMGARRRGCDCGNLRTAVGSD